MKKKRMDWVDGMKFLAILWIFCGHFSLTYDGTFFNGLRSVAGGYVFYGVTGKMCVALFCVFLGYFCAMTGRDKTRDCAAYILRRYVYFALWMLAALCIISAIVHLDRHTRLTGYTYRPIIYGPIGILADVVKLGTGISGMYWCMQPFAIASVAVVVVNRRDVGLIGQLLIAWLLYLGRAIWIMNCFFGSILYALVREEQTKKIVGRWYVRLALIAVAFFIIKRDENFMTYALDGVAMTLLVLAAYHGPWMQAVLGLRPMAALGRYSLGVYMLHEPMFLSLGSILYRQLTAIMEVKWASLLTGAVCFFLCFPLAWAIERGVGWLTAKLTEIPKFLRVRGTEKDGMGLTQ